MDEPARLSHAPSPPQDLDQTDSLGKLCWRENTMETMIFLRIVHQFKLARFCCCTTNNGRRKEEISSCESSSTVLAASIPLKRTKLISRADSIIELFRSTTSELLFQPPFLFEHEINGEVFAVTYFTRGNLLFLPFLILTPPSK